METAVRLSLFLSMIHLLNGAATFGFPDKTEFADRPSRNILGAPTMVQRALVSAIGYKQVRGSAQLGQTTVSDSYNFRMRWYEPVFWGDEASSDESRHYDLQCWVESPGQESRWIVNIRTPGSFTGYNEHYQFPAGMDVSVGCQIRAVNANNIPGVWRVSNKIRIMDVPVFFPGLEGIDLRGMTNEEFVKILAKATQQAGPPGPEDANGSS